jgi:hypothetical protein
MIRQQGAKAQQPVVMIGTGICTIDVNQAGNAQFQAAQQAQQSITLSPSSPPPA